MESKGNTVLLTVIGVATLLVALVGATFAYFTATVNNDTAQSISVTTATPVGLIYSSVKALELTNAQPDMSVGTDGSVQFTVTNPADREGEDGEVIKGSTTDQTYDLDLVINTNGFTYTACSTVTSEKNQECTNDTATQLLLKVKSNTSTTENEGTVNKIEFFTKETEAAGFTVDGDTASIDLTDGNGVGKAGNEYKLVDNQRINIGETQIYSISLEFLELGYSQDNNQGKDFSGFIKISDAVTVQ